MIEKEQVKKVIDDVIKLFRVGGKLTNCALLKIYKNRGFKLIESGRREAHLVYEIMEVVLNNYILNIFSTTSEENITPKKEILSRLKAIKTKSRRRVGVRDSRYGCSN